ncbi:hypothetical protein ZWY2020_047847 [Hordeum vulgare]|nr:hypothetical protein ZWY2020_047847 [Hordeum vulgare]
MSSWSCPEGLFYFVPASAVASAAFTWATWALLEDHHDRLAYNQLRAGINPLDATGSLRTLVAAAADPVIGRDDEIDRVVCILCRRTKNCAALVGPAGVGKTAIVEGLAQRIAAGNVPDTLVGARIVEVDMGSMVAGTHWRGMFEQRFKDAIKQAEEAQGKVILFIDEMHMVVGAGGDKGGPVDAANILKPALARGRIRCLGATTLEEYQKYIQKDAALERRFQKVDVEEPSVHATIAILQGLKHRYQDHHGGAECACDHCHLAGSEAQGLKHRYQDHHGVKIEDDALVAAAHLAARYITGFPDKAIDLMDEACATTKMHADKHMTAKNEQTSYTSTLNNEEQKAVEIIIGPGHVARVVSRWTKIPLATLDQEEKEKLTHLAKKLHERVVGQDEAVNLVAQAVLRSRVGFGQSGQPISAFLFLGPLGVGKTELAKALAEKIFDNEKALIRFDMSEHAQSGSVSRLIGGPRSYEEDGQLTEKVKRCPYSVILFEQVDKANDLVFKVFLQLLDDGMLTDGKGQVVDFKNTIIIMTSNLGAEQLTSRLTGKNTINAERDILMKQVKNRFKPEFINRLSQVVIFEPLSHSEMREIVKIQMKNVVATVANKGISLLTTDAALDFISSESHDLVHGARHIRRWVQNHVTTILSDMLVDGEACAGSTISIDAADDKRELTFQVLKKQQESWQINEMIFAVVTPMIDKEDA